MGGKFTGSFPLEEERRRWLKFSVFGNKADGWSKAGTPTLRFEVRGINRNCTPWTLSLFLFIYGIFFVLDLDILSFFIPAFRVREGFFVGYLVLCALSVGQASAWYSFSSSVSQVGVVWIVINLLSFSCFFEHLLWELDKALAKPLPWKQRLSSESSRFYLELSLMHTNIQRPCNRSSVMTGIIEVNNHHFRRHWRFYSICMEAELFTIYQSSQGAVSKELKIEVLVHTYIFSN